MYPIDPGEEYGEMNIYGQNQIDVYEPLYSRDHPDGLTVTRWKFSQTEREAIAEGKDLFLGVLRFGNPLQPLSFWVEGLLKDE